MSSFRLFLFAAVALGIGAAAFLAQEQRSRAAAPASPPPAIPVTAEAARISAVPVYLNGLGTVRALNTVEIKAQVNGILTDLPVRQGQEVHKGDIVAEIDRRPYQAALDQAVAQRAEDQAQLISAQEDLQRYETLAKRSFAPVQQVDEQRAAVNKLIAAVAADSAAIETAQINLDYCTIRSPIDGRVGFYQTDVGNLIEVANQTGILSINQDKPIEAVFTLPEADLPRIQDAMAKGPLPVLAFSADDHSKLAEGTLLTPNNAIDTGTGTIQLLAMFPNENERLWPGEFINAHLRVEVLHSAVAVPAVAVQHGPNGVFVFIVRPDGTTATQAVALGYLAGDTVVIRRGLQGGEMVVTSGQSRLAPGTRVAVQQEAPPPAAPG
jgi:membrane fusion protein, multidrug efflux system